MSKKKVVIVGAGFGGVCAALNLQKNSKLEVVLINDSPSHCFHPDLYEVATAKLPAETKKEFLRLEGSVKIPLKQIFAGKKVELIIDRVEKIDLDGKLVETRDKKIDFDCLIIAAGGKTSYFGISGAKEYSHPLKSAEDALNIRNDLEELFSKEDLKVVIAGGGFTGVELAGELAFFLPKKAQIVILEGSDHLLSGMPQWAQQLALKRLKKIGVDVQLKRFIKSVSSSSVDFADGKIDFDYLIWVTGIEGENLNNQIKGITATKKGQIHVEQDLSLKDYPHVFVLGDLVECFDIKRECNVPSTAWAAISEGKQAAKNVILRLKGKETEKYFPPYPAFVVPIGGRFALTNIFNLKISGFPAWVLKQLISLKYFLSILSISQSLNLWWKGVTIYTSNDER